MRNQNETQSLGRLIEEASAVVASLQWAVELASDPDDGFFALARAVFPAAIATLQAVPASAASAEIVAAIDCCIGGLWIVERVALEADTDKATAMISAVLTRASYALEQASAALDSKEIRRFQSAEDSLFKKE